MDPELRRDAVLDVGEWLRSLGLGQYEAAFRDNEIDPELLRTLTADDLKDLGVALVGHRRRMMTAISELSMPAAASPAIFESEPRSAAIAATHTAAERRQLTVLFCDLAGSTALSARLDPEDMREVIRAYLEACARVVTRYDGLVAKFMGDGVLAYFGFPRAHEDDAERAVQAGLDLVDLVGRLETRAGEPLKARIGVATGIVVVGDLVGQGAAQEQAVVGDTPNLAARLQALAEPGGVLIAESTRRLLGDAFELRPLGPQELKGFSTLTRAWVVLRAVENVMRFEAARSHRMTPFVGREPEVALLLDRWRDAASGEGKVALVSGEAGIGKSRIVAALRERIADEPHLALRYQCSPHHVNDAFYPIVGQIRRAAAFESGEPLGAQLDKLEAMIARSRLEPGDLIPIVASLCSVPFEDRYPPLAMAPSEQKERSIAALLALFEGLTKEAPVLALLEDAHWIDPTSLDVFNRLVDRASKLRALLVITFRPEFDAPWRGRAHVHSLPLSRFGRRHALAMIDRVADGKALPAEVLDQILTKTDGVPLFVEELTKTVLESGLLREEDGAYVLASTLTPLAIPSTLQDSLMARLDRLAPVKEIAQIGATIGREFSYRLLEAVSPLQGAALQDALGQLMAAELVYGRGNPPEATYAFKHMLVQETAYASLLKSRRQLLHQRIAESLRDGFPSRADQEPGLVAHHFTQAGLADLAIEWWDRAGARAMRRFANQEAVLSYSNGLNLIADLPKNEKRDRRDLSFRLAMGPALLAARGYASDEVERNYLEAARLADALADREAIFTSIRGLWHHLYDRGELERALALSERLRVIAAEEAGVEKRCLALRALGSTLMNKGDFARAGEAFDRCIAMDGDSPLGASFERHGEEPRIVALQYKGLTLAIRGFPETGLIATKEALSLARTMNFPLMVAFASTIVGTVLMLRRDYQACVALVSDQIDYCSEQGFIFWSAAHEILHGAARACLNGDQAGVDQLVRGIGSWRDTGAVLHIPTWSSYLAEAALCAGDLDRAEKAVSDGIGVSEKHGEAFALAELKRLTGRLRLAQGRRAEAGLAYEEALGVSRAQGAGLYLLRVGRDLARLLAEKGDTKGAQDLLEPIVGGVSEHRTGLDFQESSALLATFG